MSKQQLQLFDIHCHINFNAYKDDAAEVIQRSLEQGIGLFAVGSQASTSRRAVEYANHYENVWAVVGLHPIHLFEQRIDETEAGGELAHFRSRSEQFDIDYYRQLANSSDRVVSIGECGLDYYHVPAGVDWAEFRQLQEQAFRVQIDLALELDVPIMIHSRNAADGSTDVHADIRTILQEYATAGQPLKGDIHCFSGTVQDMREYIDLGMYISFTGNLTYKPRRVDIERGETLWDVARAAPLDRILVETDAPYLSPIPHRGERNEPAHVRYVIQKLAEIKNMPIEKVEQQIRENVQCLFKVG
ncbi:TatD family hydrolase [Patescibacteria group bacterium]|nr:TatD family hydrolase [Patescibacteria group bacterium]MBU1029432.1 TatD family hydrolase [Patescibacteria group bacterium]MBU1915787.1 TatD family hydrolase [Patescibacteria group bacterium]